MKHKAAFLTDLVQHELIQEQLKKTFGNNNYVDYTPEFTNDQIMTEATKIITKAKSTMDCREGD